jgi:hypothetical protein
LAHIKCIAILLSSVFGPDEQGQKLTVGQLTIRRVALDLFIRETESLELLFKGISGKSDTDWAT